MIAKHLAGAYSNMFLHHDRSYRVPISVPDPWRDLHRARVLHHHNQGRLVFWTADTNNANYVRATGQDAERRAFFNGVDRINWLPGDGTVRTELLDTWTIDMRVDGHDARAARFRLRVA